MNDKKILEILSETLGLDIDDISLSDTLDSLGADSLDLAEFSFQVEKQLGFYVSLSEFTTRQTIGELIHELEVAAIKQKNKL